MGEGSVTTVWAALFAVAHAASKKIIPKARERNRTNFFIGLLSNEKPQKNLITQILLWLGCKRVAVGHLIRLGYCLTLYCRRTIFGCRALYPNLCAALSRA